MGPAGGDGPRGPASPDPQEFGGLRSGRETVRWELERTPAIYVAFDPPADWSGAGAVRFWMYAEKDTGGSFTLIVNSDNPGRDRKGVDYFHYPRNIALNWKGWREFCIPLRFIRPSSQPAAWQQVNRVAFQRLVPADGVLILDGFLVAAGPDGMTDEDREVFQRHRLRAHPRLLPRSAWPVMQLTPAPGAAGSGSFPPPAAR